VLASALASLPDVHCFDRESGREAVRRVVEFAEKRFIQLPPGEKITDLVREGRRY